MLNSRIPYMAGYILYNHVIYMSIKHTDMTRNTENRIMEEVNQQQEHHWKHQWASDMIREEEEEILRDEDLDSLNDWDDWYWGSVEG